MNKRVYKAPETEVIELKQNCCLLAGSTPGYGGAGGGEGDAPAMLEDDLFKGDAWDILLGK